MMKGARMRWLSFTFLMLLLFVSIPPIETAHASGMTYYVGNTDDDRTVAGQAGCDAADNTTCSLHGALALATSGADTIAFGNNIPNAPTATTITLSQNIMPTASVTLDGRGKHVILKGGVGTCPLSVTAVDRDNHPLMVTVIALTLSDGDQGSFPGGNVKNAGMLTLNNTVVQNGMASAGGGIYNTGTLVLTNGSTVSGNTATGSAPTGNGGGISNTSGASLTIINSTVSGNTAHGSSGGGVFNEDGSVTITSSTVSGNRVTADAGSNGGGGGIYSGATLTMTNSTVSGNTANNSYGEGGGGIAIEGGTATITSSTVSGNAIMGNVQGFTGHAGGINNHGTLTLKNSLVAGNTGHNGTTNMDYYENAMNSALMYDLIGDGTNLSSADISNLIGMNPRFFADPATPQDLGGFTKTIALAADSPAIDAIPNMNCIGNTDQRGITRPQSMGGRCDIGAFESRQYALTSIGGSPQNVVARHTAVPLVVSVRDSSGSPVSGAAVTFVPPASGASGTFAGNMTTTTATTLADGTATTPPFTTNGVVGSFPIIATVENMSVTFTLTNIAPIITFAAIALPPATSGTSYALQTFTATGGTGPYAYAIASGVPTGLALGPNDGTHNGQLSGTPSVAGLSTFTVSATDTDGFTGQRNYTLSVTPDIVAVGPAGGDVGGGGSVTITGAGFVAGITSVRIGSTTAMIATVTPTQITVIAPPGIAGTADVAVTVNGQTTVRAGAYRYGNVQRTPVAHATAPTTGSTVPQAIPPTRPVATRTNTMMPTPNPAPARHQP